jgi:TPR repeat protein
MRSYHRPLLVVFSALALASLMSYAAIELTEPENKTKKDPHLPFGDGLRTIRVQRAIVETTKNTGSGKTAPGRSELERNSHSSDERSFCGEGKVIYLDQMGTEEPKNVAAFQKACNEAFGGDPRKLMALASFYLMGIGTQKNEAEAARIHWIGAEKGDAECQFVFASELLQGLGVKKDPAAGLAWLLKAADQKLPAAEYLLHQTYAEGAEVATDKSEARKWLLLAAEHGHHEARADLAEEILEEKDRKRAKSVLTWVRPGAMAGHARSCYIMGYIYSVGFGVDSDPVESMAWRLVMLNIHDEDNARSWKIDYFGLGEPNQTKAEERAKELSGQRKYVSPFARNPADIIAEKKDFAATKLEAEKGEVIAQHRLAVFYHLGRGTAKDENEAARWCRKAAEQGLPVAQYTLGQTLRLGEGVSPDLKEAFAWYMKAAKQGNIDAEHAVSVCYQEGDGVKANEEEAKKWRRLAAEHGEPRSQCNLGNDHYDKVPDIANDAIAARWYRLAAEQFHPKGGFSLGLCYLTGRGVPEDRIEGLAWMLTSADGLTPDLKDSLIIIVNDFTEDEIKTASTRSKQLAAECRAKLKSPTASR